MIQGTFALEVRTKTYADAFEAAHKVAKGFYGPVTYRLQYLGSSLDTSINAINGLPPDITVKSQFIAARDEA